LKKLIITALAAISMVASAADVTGFVSQDYASRSGAAAYETHLGVIVPTKYGNLDGAGTYFYNTSDTGNTNFKGMEFGYSNSFTYEKVKLTGRFAGGVTTNSYYVLEGEVAYPVFDNTVGYVAYRFRDGTNNKFEPQNRYSIGAEYTFDKDISGRVGYNYTDTQGYGWNGATLALAYKF
jgi:hypothetical protein